MKVLHSEFQVTLGYKKTVSQKLKYENWSSPRCSWYYVPIPTAFVALKSYLETVESGAPEFKFILFYI